MITTAEFYRQEREHLSLIDEFNAAKKVEELIQQALSNIHTCLHEYHKLYGELPKSLNNALSDTKLLFEDGLSDLIWPLQARLESYVNIGDD